VRRRFRTSPSGAGGRLFHGSQRKTPALPWVRMRLLRRNVDEKIIGKEGRSSIIFDDWSIDDCFVKSRKTLDGLFPTIADERIFRDGRTREAPQTIGRAHRIGLYLAKCEADNQLWQCTLRPRRSLNFSFCFLGKSFASPL